MLHRRGAARHLHPAAAALDNSADQFTVWAQFKGQTVLVGVDDMDVFKGIELKLLALEQVCCSSDFALQPAASSQQTGMSAAWGYLCAACCSCMHSLLLLARQPMWLWSVSQCAVCAQVLDRRPEWRGRLALVQVSLAPRYLPASTTRKSCFLPCILCLQPDHSPARVRC